MILGSRWFAGVLAVAAVVCCAPKAMALQLNEVKLGFSGMVNSSSFVELKGTPGQSLDGFAFLTINTDYYYPEMGTVVVKIPLDGYTVPASGYFVIAREFPANIANSLGGSMDGCEVLLVSDCAITVSEETDLDLDNDRVLDETPWTIVDSIHSPKMLQWRPFDGDFWVNSEPLFDDSVADHPTRGAANNTWVLQDGATGTIPCGDLGLTINVTANTFDEPYYDGGRVPTSVLLQVERIAGNPGAAGGFDGSISPTSGDGTEITVDRQAHDSYFHVEVFKRATAAGDLIYDLSMDISALTTGVADTSKLVLMKRESSSSPWVPYPTTLTGSVLSVTGLTGFSEFAVGSNSAYNTLPVSLSGLELN